MVHGLHAVPARDLPGPPGGAAELPDDDHRPHRARRRERVAPRRRHRRGGGDGARAAQRLAADGSFFVASDCHPQTIAVVQARAQPPASRSSSGAREDALATDCFGVLLQYPATTGEIVDHRELIAKLRARNVHVAMAADLLALTLLAPPGELGADIAVGSTQRFGVPIGYGGPHAAYLACSDALKRGLPGRLVGATVDSHGDTAYRLALQTREQHIRREKATSNICTSQVLLAVMAGLYAVYHGPEGLAAIARRVHRRAAVLAHGLGALGWPVAARGTSSTRSWSAPAPTPRASTPARSPRASTCGTSTPRASGSRSTRRRPKADVEALWHVFAVKGEAAPSWPAVDAAAPDAVARAAQAHERVPHAPGVHEPPLRDGDAALPARARRQRSRARPHDDPARLVHDEAQRDHRDAPDHVARVREPAPVRAGGPGAGLPRARSRELERWLCEITGYDACSLQPNAGSQGELAGLIAIRAYHASRGEAHRHVCLVPGSAHGTNPASAHMAGMRGGRGRDRRQAATSISTISPRRRRSTPRTSPRS